MKVLGPLMGFFAFLMVAVLSAIVIFLGPVMLTTGPAGWMALAMVISELIDQGAKMVGQKPFMMQKLLEGMTIVTDAIVESCRNTFNLSNEQVKEGKTIAKTVSNVARFIMYSLQEMTETRNHPHSGKCRPMERISL